MNTAKTEVMVSSKERENINVLDRHKNQLKQTEAFKYLRWTLTETGRCQAMVAESKCSVVQMERIDTSHLRQNVGKTEGEGIQEHSEASAVVWCRDVGSKRDRR